MGKWLKFEEVKKIVEELKQGKLSREEIAKKLGKTKKQLNWWIYRIGHKEGKATKQILKELGIPSPLTKDEILQAVQRIKERGEIPTRTRVAKELGITPAQLSDWAFRHRVKSLVELGIVVRSLTKERIKEAVQAIIGKDKIPTIEEVAKVCNVKSKSLRQWSRKNKIPLEDLGIIRKKRVTKFSLINLEIIKEAIETLKKMNCKTTLTNVADRLSKISGVKITRQVLGKWLKTNRVSRQELGMTQKIPRKVPKKRKKSKKKKIKIEPIMEVEEKGPTRAERLSQAIQLFNTGEEENLEKAIAMFKELLQKSDEVSEQAKSYLEKIRNVIDDQFNQAETLISLWPEEAQRLYERVIKLESALGEKNLSLKTAQRLAFIKNKLKEKEEKRKKLELYYKTKKSP